MSPEKRHYPPKPYSPNNIAKRALENIELDKSKELKLDSSSHSTYANICSWFEIDKQSKEEIEIEFDIWLKTIKSQLDLISANDPEASFTFLVLPNDPKIARTANGTPFMFTKFRSSLESPGYTSPTTKLDNNTKKILKENQAKLTRSNDNNSSLSFIAIVKSPKLELVGNFKEQSSKLNELNLKYSDLRYPTIVESIAYWKYLHNNQDLNGYAVPEIITSILHLDLEPVKISDGHESNDFSIVSTMQINGGHTEYYKPTLRSYSVKKTFTNKLLVIA